MKAVQHVKTQFESRAEAGEMLSALLSASCREGNAVLLAIPGGGLPVALEVAKILELPLDVLVVQRVIASQHVPWQQELSLGAVAYGGGEALNPEIIERSRILPQQVEAAVNRARNELHRREHLYRGECPFPEISGRTIVLVDDGIRTGATMRAAIQSLRALGAGKIVVAAPVGVVQACKELGRMADEFICPVQDPGGGRIHSRYRDYPNVTDEEIRAMVKANRYQPCA